MGFECLNCDFRTFDWDNLLDHYSEFGHYEFEFSAYASGKYRIKISRQT